MAASKTGKVVVLYNGRGSNPKIKQGGKQIMAAKKGSARGRKTGAKAGSGRAKAKPKARGRRAGATRAAAPRAYEMNGSGRSGRRGARRSGARHYRPNPSGIFGTAQNLVGQLFFGGLGAFATSTASQLNPVQPASNLWASCLDVLIALGVAWAGGKVFPKHRDTIRIGAFAFVAGNIVTRYAPTLQQQIVSLSPINRQLTAGSNAGSPIDDEIADVTEVMGGPGFADVSEVGLSGGQYF
jgi:hypothetical protein